MVPKKPEPKIAKPFEGLFRTKRTAQRLSDLEKAFEALDEYAAREHHQAVRAIHYQLAIEIAERMDRPDLVQEFTEKRDEAIMKLRQTPRLRRKSDWEFRGKGKRTVVLKDE